MKIDILNEINKKQLSEPAEVRVTYHLEETTALDYIQDSVVKAKAKH